MDLAISKKRQSIIEAALLLGNVLFIYGHKHLHDEVLSKLNEWRDSKNDLFLSDVRYAAVVAVKDISSDWLDSMNHNILTHDGDYVKPRSIREALKVIVTYFL